jgi:hypothetical protein
LESFYQDLEKGDAGRLLSIFEGEPSIDTPLDGEVRGAEAFSAFVKRQGDWLTERKARIRVINSIHAPERVVIEFVTDLVDGTRAISLPIALVADTGEEKVTGIRICHSTYPLYGEHMTRKPMLEPRRDLREPEVIREYMRGLAGRDSGPVLSLFAPGAYVREPSGDEYKHQGEEALKAFYDSALRSGGIPLKHCTATFDGKTFAVEFTVDRWGETRLENQAGMAVYQLTDDARKIEAVRIYDDVTPPGEHE